MSELIARTNGQSRPLLRWEDLTPEEQEKVDERFVGFKYRGELYDLDDFEAPRGDGPLGSYPAIYGYDEIFYKSAYLAVAMTWTYDHKSVYVTQLYTAPDGWVDARAAREDEPAAVVELDK